MMNAHKIRDRKKNIPNELKDVSELKNIPDKRKSSVSGSSGSKSRDVSRISPFGFTKSFKLKSFLKKTQREKDFVIDESKEAFNRAALSYEAENIIRKYNNFMARKKGMSAKIIPANKEMIDLVIKNKMKVPCL